ncbi:MAG TPA: signal peptidase I [Candidatus Limnocylindria bacterium]|nr:signal peptidase I [Candidatus Limnocylindria bacterium]
MNVQRGLGLVRKMIGASPSSDSVSAGRHRLLKLAALVVLSFCSYLFFSHVVVSAVEVKGASMSPTLNAGDRFLLNRFAYLHREPERGELVVLKDPETGELIVKRIIGLPCETVVMQSDAVYVNGHRMFEPYASVPIRPDRAPLGKATVIPRNYYFVLGDNRMRSLDSRTFGPVSRESILGVITL